MRILFHIHYRQRFACYNTQLLISRNRLNWIPSSINICNWKQETLRIISFWFVITNCAEFWLSFIFWNCDQLLKDAFSMQILEYVYLVLLWTFQRKKCFDQKSLKISSKLTPRDLALLHPSAWKTMVNCALSFNVIGNLDLRSCLQINISKFLVLFSLRVGKSLWYERLSFLERTALLKNDTVVQNLCRFLLCTVNVKTCRVHSFCLRVTVRASSWWSSVPEKLICPTVTSCYALRITKVSW